VSFDAGVLVEPASVVLHGIEKARPEPGESAAVIVAGGHVNVLADVLHLFNVAAALNAEARDPAGDPAGRPVIAWSAGAMALTERIVLFHDRAPQGPGHPEVYSAGLSVLRDVVLLPHARTRLLLDDVPRMAMFARRFEPARCVLLDNGTRIDTDDADTRPDARARPSADAWLGDRAWPPGVRVLAADGRVTALEAA
jgi:hypothetical protein